MSDSKPAEPEPGDGVQLEGRSYRWIENWANQPDEDAARDGWAHHGLAVTARGEVIAFHAGESRLLVFSPEGELTRSFDCPVREAHGQTLVEEDGVEFVWIADPGVKAVRQPDGSYGAKQPDVGGQAVKVGLDGTVALTLATPPLPVYEDAVYRPTAVAVDEERHGGTGDVWVTDGYGQNLVHRYNSAGEYQGTISGEEGDAGAFSCPHSIFIDRRHGGPELYVADRSNARIQVYDLTGKFLRSFGEDFLNSPSAFALLGDRLIVAELFSRLAVLDPDDKLVGYLGPDPEAKARPGWPNAVAEDGTTTRAPVQAGKFNSPHGIATDPAGAIYVTEWLVGDRFTKLDPA